jgi:hypothetical protein
VKLDNFYSAADTYNYNDKIRESEIGRACSTGMHTDFDGKVRREATTMKTCT